MEKTREKKMEAKPKSPSTVHVDPGGRRRRAMSTYREDGISLYKMQKETSAHFDATIIRSHSTPDFDSDGDEDAVTAKKHFHGQWQKQADGTPVFHYVQLDKRGCTSTRTRRFPGMMWEELEIFRMPVVTRRESVQWTRYEIENDVYHSFAVCVTRPRVPVEATPRGYCVRKGCEYLVPVPYFQDAASRDWLVATQRELKRRRVVITHDDFWSTVEFSSPSGGAQFVHVDVTAPFLEYNDIDPVPYIHHSRQTYIPFTAPSSLPPCTTTLIPRSASAEHFTRPSEPLALPKSASDLEDSPRRSSEEEDDDAPLPFAKY